MRKNVSCQLFLKAVSHLLQIESCFRLVMILSLWSNLLYILPAVSKLNLVSNTIKIILL